MGTPFTPGQMSKLQSVVNIGVATALPRLAEKYGDPKAVLRVLDGRGAIFAERLEMALEQAINSMLDLAPRGTETVILTERHDPDTFYRTCEGLYVWDDFRSRIVANAKPSELGRTMKVNCAELMRDLTDKEIELALPIDHLFDETEVCAVIAGLIASQPNGEEGALLNTGYANLFYTSSCVVYVYWYADYRGWHVNAWKRGDYGWGAGYQVFSPAN